MILNADAVQVYSAVQGDGYLVLCVKLGPDMYIGKVFIVEGADKQKKEGRSHEK